MLYYDFEKIKEMTFCRLTTNHVKLRVVKAIAKDQSGMEEKFENAFSCNLCVQNQSQCDEAPGMYANFITLGSMLLVLVSLPFSLFFVVKVVQVSSI